MEGLSISTIGWFHSVVYSERYSSIFFLPLVVLIDINERMLRYCRVLSRNQNNEDDSNNKKTEQTYLIYWNIFLYSKDGEEDNEEIEPIIQARFIRAVAQLQLLGFVQSSKRKTDHVARLTWGI